MEKISTQHMDIMDIWKHFFQTDVDFPEGAKMCMGRKIVYGMPTHY